MKGCGHTSGPASIETMFFNNLQVILEYGGLPAVILLFGYLYLQSMTKEMTRQLGQMQEQLNNQQIAMNVLIQNNTRALTRLGTAMMMGCPFIKNYLDPAIISLGGDENDDGVKEKASDERSNSG